MAAFRHSRGPNFRTLKLTLFFTSAALQERITSAQSILNALKNPIYKMYFLFLSYILEIINPLNMEFQSEKPKIHVLLLDRVFALFKLVLKAFMKKEYVNETPIEKINVLNPSHYVQLETIYCGAKVAELINTGNVNEGDLKNVRLRVLHFYIELSIQIKKRFNFCDETLNFAAKFKPESVMLNIQALQRLKKNFQT